jgi:hypothetical protein
LKVISFITGENDVNLNDMKKVENQNRRDIRGKLSAQGFVEDEDLLKKSGVYFLILIFINILFERTRKFRINPTKIRFAF